MISSKPPTQRKVISKKITAELYKKNFGSWISFFAVLASSASIINIVRFSGDVEIFYYFYIVLLFYSNVAETFFSFIPSLLNIEIDRWFSDRALIVSIGCAAHVKHNGSLVFPPFGSIKKIDEIILRKIPAWLYFPFMIYVFSLLICWTYLTFLIWAISYPFYLVHRRAAIWNLRRLRSRMKNAKSFRTGYRAKYRYKKALSHMILDYGTRKHYRCTKAISVGALQAVSGAIVFFLLNAAATNFYPE